MIIPRKISSDEWNREENFSGVNRTVEKEISNMTDFKAIQISKENSRRGGGGFLGVARVGGSNWGETMDFWQTIQLEENIEFRPGVGYLISPKRKVW